MQQLSLIPVCEKHGVEKHWRKDPSCPGGGRWRCRECRRASDALYLASNREKCAEASRRWREKNPDYYPRHYRLNKPRVKARNNQYRKVNAEKINSINATRRARKVNCAVELDAIDRAIVDAIYAKARKVGKSVDHIMPLFLQGEHAPWNLRVLPLSENCSIQGQRPTLREVMRGERRYRLLRRIFERAGELGAITEAA